MSRGEVAILVALALAPFAPAILDLPACLTRRQARAKMNTEGRGGPARGRQ